MWRLKNKTINQGTPSKKNAFETRLNVVRFSCSETRLKTKKM
jgi:hypothetical protein